MVKRATYPLYGENRPRKVLRNLVFEEIPLTEPQGGGSARADAAESGSAAVHELLLEAMRTFYDGTCREWLIKYWHGALQPSALTSVDKAQRLGIIAQFEHSVKQECERNHAELIAGRAWEASEDKVMPFTSTMLLYAKNFEVRTKQRLQSIMLLDSYFRHENNGLSLLEAAKSNFGSIMFDSFAGSTIGSEIRQALAPDAAGIQSVGLQVFTKICLVTKTFQSFLDANYIPGLDPVAVTLEVLTRSMRTNLEPRTELLHDSFKELLPSVPSVAGARTITLDLMQEQPAILQYIAQSVVPIVEDWLARVKQWKQYSTEVVTLLYSMLGPSMGLDLESFSRDVVLTVVDEDEHGLAELLGIYVLFKFVSAGSDSQDELSNRHSGILSVSKRISGLVACSLHARVFGEKGGHGSTIQRGVWIQTISQIYCDLLDADNADADSVAEFRMVLKQKVSDSMSGNVYREIHQAHSGLAESEEILRSLNTLETSGLLRAYASGTVPDWDEDQARGLEEDVALSLLPRRIGGRNVDVAKERLLLAELAKYIPGGPSSVLDLMVDEAAGFSEVGPLYLEFGNWPCAEDPSVSTELPPVLREYVDAPSLAARIEGRPGFDFLWHAGWSTLDCEWSGHHFSCTATQLEVLKRLLASSTPLTLQELVSRAFEESDTALMADLVMRSNGLVKMAQHPTGTTMYAADVSRAPPASLVKLQFV